MELQSKLVYPNPFEPNAIEFTISVDGSVTLEILDQQGKTIATPIAQKPYSAGTHKIELVGILPGSPFGHPFGNSREAVGARFYRLSIENKGEIMRDVKAIQIGETEA